MKACGGLVVAESQETAVIFGMPQQVIREGAADAVLPLQEIATAIRESVARRRKREFATRGFSGP